MKHYLTALFATIFCISIAGFPATTLAATRPHSLHLPPLPGTMDSGLKAKATKASTYVNPGNGVAFHGGEVMTGSNTIYLIWRGDWSRSYEWMGDGSSSPQGQQSYPEAQNILRDFVSKLGATNWFATLTSYYGADQAHVKPSLKYFSNDYSDPSSTAFAADDDYGQDGTFGLVRDAINHGMPNDPNGIYIVMPSKEVTVPGLGKSFCGWHSAGVINHTVVKYALIPDLTTVAGCTADKSPNDNFIADGIAPALAHEIAETITNPLDEAWTCADEKGLALSNNVACTATVLDSGGEIADLCSWSNGPTYTAANGEMANVAVGNRSYLLQQLWVNAAGGFCGLSLDRQPLTVSVTGSGGWIYSAYQGQTAGIACNNGLINQCSVGYGNDTYVTLSSQKLAPYVKFNGWGGTCQHAGQSSTCTVRMNQTRQVTASYSSDSYDEVLNQLSIPLVKAYDKAYYNVLITVDKVLAVNADTASVNYDSYDDSTNQLTIPSVHAYGKDYTNVVITVGKVLKYSP